MVQREVRYALVDLGNQTWDVKGICADNFGTWGTYLQELRFWWEIDPTLVVLTTGVLTGTGAPGTGAMTWCYLGKTGTVCTAEAEGRLGAYLRYAGVDAVLFLNRSEKPCCVTVDNGALELTHPQMDELSLLANRKNEDAVIATVAQNAVLEDKYFAIAGKDVASRLQSKGVEGLFVEDTGILPVADPAAVVALSTELWQTVSRSGCTRQPDRQHPAYFLSPDHTADFESRPVYENQAKSGEDAMYAALGILWSQALAQFDRRKYTAKLITACTGAPCTEEDLDALNEYLVQLRQKKVGGEA